MSIPAVVDRTLAETALLEPQEGLALVAQVQRLWRVLIFGL